MGRIRVICATPPGPNPGMASVDLAFHALGRRHRLAAQIVFDQLHTAGEMHVSRSADERGRILLRQALPFSYVCSRGRPEDIWESDAIVFWGDFLQMELHQKTVGARLLQMRIAANEAEARRLAMGYFLLAGAPENVLGKALSFGGTLILDRGAEHADPEYAANFRRFLRGARRVWMRDVFSALKVAHAREEADRLYLGADCAQLLEPDDLKSLPRSAWSAEHGVETNRVGVFFGRTRAPARQMMGLAARLCRALGGRPRWIPWGTKHAFPELVRAERPPERAREIGPPLLGDLFESISRCRLVVSDTYHLCVLAWTLGIPAVCIGQAIVADRDNVNSGRQFHWRDKRQAFYGMHDALDFYVYSEELARPGWADRRVGHIAALLKDPAVIPAVVRRMRDQAKRAEAALVAELRTLIGQ